MKDNGPSPEGGSWLSEYPRSSSLSSCPTPVASILQDLAVGLTSPVWHTSVTHCSSLAPQDLGHTRGCRFWSLHCLMLLLAHLFLLSVEDKVQDSEKKGVWPSAFSRSLAVW